ncbi:MAG: proton-conducting transporter membrane subunit [Candidatus Omnitrophica bacterium]|nr:proton-conducting transporter membrane subunit [Candidatus Omnitrophota bacterium]
MPSLVILVPLIALLILNLPLGEVMRKASFWVALGFFIFQTVLLFCHHFRCICGSERFINSFFGMDVSVDHLSFMVMFLVNIVALTSLLVARHAIKDSDARFNFINLIVIASAGMNGVTVAKDIFSLYVFLEVTAVALFIAIALQREPRALEGAFKYILLSSIATVMMLTSIAVLFFAAGDTSFASLKSALQVSGKSPVLLAAIGVFICGLFIKGGLVPFHGWLPDAYSAAPAPVSVLLAGIVTKVSGIYTLMRLVAAVFGFKAAVCDVLLFGGTLSILVGAFAALGQKDFKRMLAYSSISQVGYIIVGLGTGTALGIAGAIFHFFNHAIFKTLLFVNAAAVEESTGLRNMNKMGGLSSRMPVTGATSVMALLSNAGIPPLAGFWSKVIIIIALWVSGRYAYAVIAILAAVVTLAYLLIMQRKVFFGNIRPELDGTKEAGPGYVIASVVLAAITVGAGIFFPYVFDHVIIPARSALLP